MFFTGNTDPNAAQRSVFGSHRRFSPPVSALSRAGSCSLAGGRDLFVLEGAGGERSPCQRGQGAFRGVGRGDVQRLQQVFKSEGQTGSVKKRQGKWEDEERREQYMKNTFCFRRL